MKSPSLAPYLRKRSRRIFPRPAGFALIITLTLAILLVVMAVGLLVLGNVTLRTSSREAVAAQARANARLALALAIGALQKDVGPDTRVTARADILDPNNPPVLGAWKSWEGSDHDTKGRPVSPGDYRAAKDRRFIGWLTSSSGDGKTLPDTSARRDAMTLVGARTIGNDAGRARLQIHLTPQPIEAPGGKGGFAWWVGGENQKARLPQPFVPIDDSAAGWAVLAKSHTVPDPTEFRMAGLLKDSSQVAKTTSLLQSNFLAPKDSLDASQQFFYDLSATSVGLMTNTATGGWRKDLSLATENWAQLPNSNLPFFRLNPETDLYFSKPTKTSATPDKSMLYPWSAYRGGNDEVPIYKQGAIGSWENLKEWVTAYKRVTSNSTGRSVMPYHTVSIDDAGDSFGYLHQLRIMPVAARVQWVFAYSAAPVPSRPGYYEPRLLVTPVITMWNPYSVEISAPEMGFSIPKPLPVALRYTLRGVARPSYNCLTAGSTNNLPAMSQAGGLSYRISPGFTLKPGESRVFSPAARNVLPPTQELLLQPGYRGSGGTSFPLMDDTGMKPLQVADGAFKAQAKFDTSYNDINDGVGIYLDTIVFGARHLAYRMIYPPAVANVIYPPLTGLAETTLGAASTTPVPFMSTVFGTRLASRTHLASKGFVQSSPLVFYTAMGTKDLAERTISRHYGGTGHPVNSPFDYSFIKHAPGGDSYLPNSSDSTNRGYIVTGFNKADGLSRCVVAEIPTRPVLSLGELQGWDARFENPIPPYAFNLTGNSDATPLLPAGAVVNSTDASLTVNLQHDDSYCLNHILFDDWFFSSIAPSPASFGPSGGRNLQATYTDFVKGVQPLDNRAYRPVAADFTKATASSDGANALYDTVIKPADAYRTIAAHLEVEGMFNVNSTSVTAWRALLGHARNQRVPYLRETGTSWNATLSDETDYPYSRFAIAGDVQAGKAGSSGDFSEASEFAGYRVLDEKLIDKLAEAIVDEVRARGPFLSLAEFVNRQLSSGDLAIAGAIQAALNKLAASGDNPYAAIQGLVGDAGKSSATPVLSEKTEYRFPAAANGWNAYGLPGWTRQADVLRPIAPLLSARDDTFTIRAHGDARSADGRIESRAICEAVVRRCADYVDPAEPAATAVALKSPINRQFGRRFEIVSFRWLSPSEI